MHFPLSIILKRILFIVVFAHTFYPVCASEWVGINAKSRKEPTLNIIQSDDKKLNLHFENFGFNQTEIVVDGIQHHKISIPECGVLLNKKDPELPVFAKSIIIPDKGSFNIQIISTSYVEFENYAVIPSKGNVYRNQNLSEIPFEFGSNYQQDQYYPNKVVSSGEPYILRDYRGVNLTIHPIVYNPVQKVLRVYTDIQFDIVYNQEFSINEFLRTNNTPELSAEFQNIYLKHFLNLPTVQYTPLSEIGSMLIISGSMYTAALQPLMEWKIQKGIPTEWVDIAQIGADQNLIKNYILNYYLNHGLTFVLLVGDHQDVPSYLALNGDANDPVYGHLMGNDSYAEVMIGRLSANSISDVQTQVNRIIQYEKFPNTSTQFYNKAVCVASDQGPGDDGEMDYEHARNMRSDLLTYNFNNVDELYDGSQGGADAPGNPTASMLSLNIQDGRSILLYTGHGSSSGCTTTGFNINDINALSNFGMLPFVFSVACVNGDFTGITCFAEALLRATSNGQATGTIGALMSSNNQTWNPPMDGQDEIVDLICEMSINGYMRTFGGISVNGCMHMNDVYGAAGAEMTNSWHMFGDPSTVLRTAVPIAISASHLNSIGIGSNQFTVNCNINGATVCLSQLNEIVSSGIITNGSVNLSFTPLSSFDTLVLTISGHNLLPYQSKLNVIPSGGAFVLYSNHAFDDSGANSNGIIEYNENGFLNIQIQNAGTVATGALNAVLNSTDPHVQIFSNTALITSIASLSNHTISSAFQLQISDSVPDQYAIPFTLLVSGNAGSWVTNFNVLVNAPSLQVVSMSIDDSAYGNGNGKADPGENLLVKYTVENIGHSTSMPIQSSVSCNYPQLIFNSQLYTSPSLGVGLNTVVQFSASVLPAAIPGDVFTTSIISTAGKYASQKNFVKFIGDVMEDFESGDFLQFNWNNLSALPWLIDSNFSFQGNFSTRSGLITHSENTDLLITLQLPTSDSLTFYYSTSSEAYWDKLLVFDNAVELDRYSGIQPWTKDSFLLNSGLHELLFRYEKDGSVSAGADAVWIDNIRFPVFSTITGIALSNQKSKDILVYPNPAEDYFYIESENIKENIEIVELYSIDGKHLYEWSDSDNLLMKSKYLLPHIDSGTYILVIKSDIQFNAIVFKVISK